MPIFHSCLNCGADLEQYGIGTPENADQECTACGWDENKSVEPQHGSDHEEGCTFLGRYTVNTEQGEFRYDLWWAEQPGLRPTLIARWSQTPSDYSSGMAFGWIEDQPNSPLVEARKRAEALNLDVQRDVYARKMRRHPSGMYYTAGEELVVHDFFGNA